MLDFYKESSDYDEDVKQAAPLFMCYCYVFAAVYHLLKEEQTKFALGILSQVGNVASLPAYALFKSSVDNDDFKE